MKVSPLNIIIAIAIAGTAYLYLFKDAGGWRIIGVIPLIGVAILSFIADVMFKTYIKDIKRIWIVELAFIIFAAVLMVLISRI